LAHGLKNTNAVDKRHNKISETEAPFGYRPKFQHIGQKTLNLIVVWLISSVAVINGFIVTRLRN
jgi:hypothetical protein